MGLVNLVISTVGKCLDVVCLLLDLNFVIVHTVVRTVLAVVSFINSLPSLLLCSVLELGNFAVFCLVSAAEATSNLAQGSVTMLGSLGLVLEGLLESLKMVGYLFMHVLLRGRDHLCRGLLSLGEGCGIAVSLVVYFINTVVNYALITTQNLYLGVVSMWQTVSSPLQKVLELALTSITFLYSSLLGTSAFLWSPCKLVLDFLVSLVHMFISIFILNIYGLMLTAAIAVATTVYLNPEQARQAARLQRILHHLYLLERGLWQQLSRHSSQLGLLLRAHLHRDNNRTGGDGDPGAEERRDPPDGRANDVAHQEMLDLALPSCSTDRPLMKQSKDSKPLPAEELLNLLKEQEERKKCVICQDCTKTVVLLPCRHLCLCKDCKDILLRQPISQQNCPLCRHMILSTMDVYL
uniref:E3 ubiquitin-protein ligase RNF26 n=1 Tax=Sphaeramia orbicularis TaxID=375764 RepID=A0A672ZN38_9TELE